MAEINMSLMSPAEYEELCVDNECLNWANSLKTFLKEKLAKYLAEIRNLKIENDSLNMQLNHKKNTCSELERQNEVLLMKCVDYEMQIATLAVQKNDKKQKILDEAQSLAAKLNNVITHLKIPETDENAETSNSAAQAENLLPGFSVCNHIPGRDIVTVAADVPCDSSTSVTSMLDFNDLGSVVPYSVPQEIKFQPRETAVLEQVEPSLGDAESGVQILESASIRLLSCMWMNPHITSRCDRVFRTAADLSTHLQDHVDEAKSYNYWCMWQNCTTFTGTQHSKSKLMDHLLEHTGQKHPNMYAKGFVNTASRQMDRCIRNTLPCPFPACGKTFSSMQNLKGHQDLVHKGCGGREPMGKRSTAATRATRFGEASTSGVNVKPYVCLVIRCGKRFKQKAGLAYHVRTAHKDANYL